MQASGTVIALEPRLRECRNVLTLGVKPNFSEYSETEREQIQSSPRIYYPTAFYAEIFSAMGKPIFPSVHTYRFAQDKIKQTALFALAGIPHPKTGVYYGKRQYHRIHTEFSYPMVGKIPRGSARGKGVFLIRNPGELERYLNLSPLAYIQEYLLMDRDIRVVVIGERPIHAYWRISPPGEFRTNVAVGAQISLDPVPQGALDLAVHTARSCGWNDVGLDICPYNGTYAVLEANMKYGKEGFRAAGLHYPAIMEEMIEHGDI
jgi:ribosomal protein S6--L-glutamate ligase